MIRLSETDIRRLEVKHAKTAKALALRREGKTLREVGDALGGYCPQYAASLIAYAERRERHKGPALFISQADARRAVTLLWSAIIGPGGGLLLESWVEEAMTIIGRYPRDTPRQTPPQTDPA